MKTYFRILSYSRPLGKYFPFYMVSSLISIVFGLVNIILLMPLFDIIFEQKSSEEIASYQSVPEFSLTQEYFSNLFNHYMFRAVETFGDFGSLLFVCSIIVLSVFVSNIFRYIAAVILVNVRVKIMRNMRMDVFSNISKMHIGYFSDQRKGDILSRVSNDMQEIETSINQSLKVLFRDPATIIVYFSFLFYLSFQLTLFSLILIPLAGGIIAGIAKRLKKTAKQNQESLGRILNIFDESIWGMRVIKAFNAVGYINKVFTKEVKHYAAVNSSYSKRFELAGPISEFLGVFASVGLVVYGGSLVLEKDFMEPSAFIAYLAIFAQVMQPAKNISNAVTSIQRGIVAADRIFVLTDVRSNITDKKDAKELVDFSQAVELKNVSFAYEKEQVLKNINFSIPKGQTIALVGPSGGGKSTIADLLPRFYDPTKGEVQIDGNNLKDLKLESIRKFMGIVTQESILFNDTVFNNIAFGLENISEEQVIRAAKIANAHEFIVQMEHQYQTLIGERGSKLSGGQRQRLSIARAVLKNPPILILDEATSALDTQSEKLVQEALSNLMKNRTSLVIAHRLSTIQNADLILVVKDGEIVERGNHSELIERQGFYYKLIEMQSL